jgi:GcrA cell cycle regulator
MTARPDADGWTTPRVALLVNHYQAGLSAAESAVLIGGVSKNAVVSKRRRLGLFAMLRAAQAGASPRREAYVPVRPFRGPPPLPTEPLPAMDLVRPLNCAPMRLTERRRNQCAWPLGPAEEPADYSTLFCGAPVATASSYCALHAERARRR